MYDLLIKLFFGTNATSVPTGANGTLIYCAAAIAILITILLADMIFRLIKSVFGRSQY